MAYNRMMGEITCFAFDVAVDGFVPCDGLMLSTSGNMPLFAIISTQFGGNGTTDFALPDLRGRTALNPGNGFVAGGAGGEEVNKLTPGQMPSHTHQAYCSSYEADQPSPENNLWAGIPSRTSYSIEVNQEMADSCIAYTGADEPHENMSPFLALNYSICTVGIYPDRATESSNDLEGSANVGDPAVDGFLGEIVMFAGSFLPQGWAFCAGQLLSIATNRKLFDLIGTTYGGNGTTNFALPDLTGRAVIGAGQGLGLTDRQPGDTGGSTQVTLDTDQMPIHNHQAMATSAEANAIDPANGIWAISVGEKGSETVYASGVPTAMFLGALAPTEGDQPHDNMPPFLGINYIICVDGEVPDLE